MSRLVLDTSELIRHWNRCWGKSAKPISAALVGQWAKNLIQFYDTNAVVTPVVIEFLAGFTSGEQLQLAKHYLRSFECIDDQKITGGLERSLAHRATDSTRRQAQANGRLLDPCDYTPTPL